MTLNGLGPDGSQREAHGEVRRNLAGAAHWQRRACIVFSLQCADICELCHRVAGDFFHRILPCWNDKTEVAPVDPNLVPCLPQDGLRLIAHTHNRERTDMPLLPHYFLVILVDSHLS